MHVSPAKQLCVTTKKVLLLDRQTHRCRTKWSLCAAMLHRRHKNMNSNLERAKSRLPTLLWWILIWASNIPWWYPEPRAAGCLDVCGKLSPTVCPGAHEFPYLSWQLDPVKWQKISLTVLILLTSMTILLYQQYLTLLPYVYKSEMHVHSW